MHISALININAFPVLFSSQSKAKSVMAAAILVNKYQDEDSEEDISKE